MVHQLNCLDQWAYVLIAGKNGLHLEVPLQSMAHHSWHFNYAYAHEHIFHHLLSLTNLNRVDGDGEMMWRPLWWGPLLLISLFSKLSVPIFGICVQDQT